MTKKDDKVGPGRPPAATRFKAGQSGNPKGRPKRQHSLSEAITRAMGRKFEVTVAGQRQMVPALDAAVQRAFQRGKPSDLKFIAGLAAQLERNCTAVQSQVDEGPVGWLLVSEAPKTFDEWEKQYSEKAGAVGPDGKTQVQRQMASDQWPPRTP